MNKSELLKKATHYYFMQNKELHENGDTTKRRNYIYDMIDCMNRYINCGGKYLGRSIYKPMIELKEEYYEELIFTPTVEDLEEMKYWL